MERVTDLLKFFFRNDAYLDKFIPNSGSTLNFRGVGGLAAQKISGEIGPLHSIHGWPIPGSSIHTYCGSNDDDAVDRRYTSEW